jgi:hypothetical protein
MFTRSAISMISPNFMGIGGKNILAILPMHPLIMSYCLSGLVELNSSPQKCPRECCFGVLGSKSKSISTVVTIIRITRQSWMSHGPGTMIADIWHNINIMCHVSESE